ncbi:MAG: hypothetical protein K9H58_08200 [Bacteroidales bacterium]|nr:hypothetical protein [Bacteroidales bacterium]
MKKQGFYLLMLFSATILLLISACSKDNTEPSQEPTKDAPTFETKTVTPPDAMMESSDPGAQMAVSYISLANSFSGFAGMMTPPGGAPYKSTLEGEPWVYTWEFNEGQDVYFITLTILETTTHFEWNMLINGTLSGLVLTDFLYMDASQTLDGSSGEYTLYDPEEVGYVMKASWSTDAAGVYMLSFEIPEDVIIELVTNPNGSGEIATYEWNGNVKELTFEAIWDATGHGEWWEYFEGALSDHGTW